MFEILLVLNSFVLGILGYLVYLFWDKLTDLEITSFSNSVLLGEIVKDLENK